MDPLSRSGKATAPPAQDLTVVHPAAPEEPPPQDVTVIHAAAGGSPDNAPPPAAVDPAALVGQSFGDFEVLEELGRGGMGIVYKAHQKSLDRVVALKVLPANLAAKGSLRGRFLAEAKACASLAHPNILTIYHTGESPIGPYCAMEYIDGQTLDQMIEGRTVSIPSAVNLLFRLAEAVHHAHSKGIIHRDLKPGNIMLDKNRRPVVMDFGLAKLLENPTGLTQEGDIIGTPGYMAPEQARGSLGQIGPASDVYSLGAILYRLLTGRPPYDEGKALDTILKVLGPTPPPSPRTFRPEIPPALEQICMRCLQKDPAKRYPTAHALAVDLRNLRTGAPEQPRGPATMKPLAPRGFLVMTWCAKQLPLLAGAILLGRSPDCDIELPALTVSERHCRIIVDAHRGTVEVVDLDSASGVLVNGKRVQKRGRLQDGDRMDIGGYQFQLRIPRPKT